MAAKNSKGKASSKKSTSKSTARGNTKRSSRSTKKEPVRRGLNPQTKAILLCAVGALLLALVIIPGGAFWKTMRSFLFGVFGVCSILVPLVFIYLGIMTAKEKQMAHKGAKIALSAVIVVMVCTLVYLFGKTDFNDGYTYFAALGAAYQKSFALESLCGLIGAVLGYPMRALLTTAPAVITSFIILIAAIMVLFGVTLIDIANVAKKGYTRTRERQRQIHEHRNERREERRREREEREEFERLGNRSPEDDYPDYTVPESRSGRRSNDRIDIPLDKPGKKPRAKDAVEIAEEQQDQDIINIIRNANSGVVPDEELSASDVARRISDKKKSRKMSAGAKQPDPGTAEDETVDEYNTDDTFDLKGETRRVGAEVKQNQKTEQAQYVYPSTKLLEPAVDSESESAYMEMQNNATKLIETLNSFGVKANIVDICRGPSVTRYELQPAPGVKISKITNLSDDIALNLAANGVRIEAPIPGKAAVGIEVPNKVTSMVTLRELVETDEFRNHKSKLNCVLGRDISGEIITTDLAKMPHLLIAGTTGSGKSVCVNALLMSILFKATPDEVKLLLVDPKMVEFSKYKGIPHLLVPVVSDAKKAAGALNWAVSEMLQRYRVFSEYDCKGIDSFNELVDKNLAYIEEQKQKPDYDPEAEEQPCLDIDGLKVPTEHMCRIVIAIDELADLMMAAPSEVEESICRLAQMARAAGMHLILATQRPTVNVITGLIKANIPSRIALKVSSQIDSRTILDTGGAEKLIGRGDLLYAPVGAPKPIRVQCCFTRDDEIDRVTAFLKKSHTAEYNKEIEDKIRKIAAEELNGNKGKDNGVSPGNAPEVDAMMEDAIKFVIESGQASTSMLQRRLKVGYARAGRMIDDMEQMGIVGPHQGSKPREVLITMNDWLERNNMLGSPEDDTAGEGEGTSDDDDPW
ncbi:DNA translocase FtsK [Ruminococcus sp.]|uniref:FtsK/SpoIIIE family DNA translocase n=1 Tax=Ruminococcus sp. TaxID=41978 RepID=UPI00386B2C42